MLEVFVDDCGVARCLGLAWDAGGTQFAAIPAASSAAEEVVAMRLWRRPRDSAVNTVALRTPNAAAQSMIARFRPIKRKMCGYRSRVRLHNAICVHRRGLGAYPRPSPTTRFREVAVSSGST